ncbi:MAG TPA: hypothetical protein VHR88_09075 [Solirubrobacteraceae bacterium]|jgi:hypothetical protein|nr:hypothetical protein [Solirubrobacteraceae bacterium]
MRTGREAAGLAAALVAAAELAACGGGGGGHKGPTPAQDRAAVRGTLVKLERATAAHDYATMCNQVLARELIARVAGAGLPCQTALKLGLRGVRQPHLQVTTIKVSGNRALAQVYSAAKGQRAATDVVQLVRERGAWRVASLAGPQPPAPPRAA